MAELKTKRTAVRVEAFLNSIPDENRRKECQTLAAFMKKATKSEPAIWGTSIVGFGSYRYRYASGREGDWFLTGFAPRKDSLSIYLIDGVERHKADLKALGKCKVGMGCVYIKSLDSIDLPTLKKMVTDSLKNLKALEKGRSMNV